MRGIKGYRWSRCNVARGNVSCMVALQCMPEDRLNLKVVLPCFHIITKHIEADVAYITLQPGTHFLKARFSQELHNFARGDLRTLPLKHACARKLRTLIINYTQLTVKGQVFFQKKINYAPKIVMCRCGFERAP